SGKSTLAAAIAARVSVGKDFFGNKNDIQGHVLYLVGSGEGSADSIYRRISKLEYEYDLDRITVIDDIYRLDEKTFLDLEALIAQRKTKLVIVDSMTAFTTASNKKMIDANEIRELTGRFSQIALKNENECAVMFNHHFNAKGGIYGSVDMLH